MFATYNLSALLSNIGPLDSLCFSFKVSLRLKFQQVSRNRMKKIHENQERIRTAHLPIPLAVESFEQAIASLLEPFRTPRISPSRSLKFMTDRHKSVLLPLTGGN